MDTNNHSNVLEIAMLANKHCVKRELESAASLLKEALLLDEQSIVIMHSLGLVLTQLGRWEDARSIYSRALQLDLDHPISKHGFAGSSVMALQAKQVVDPNEYVEPLNLLQEAYELRQNDPTICNDLAFTYYMTGDVYNAHEFYLRCLKLDPMHERALAFFCLLLQKTGRHNDAISVLRNRRNQIERMKGETGGLWYAIGIILRSAGNEADAIDCLREAALRRPTTAAIYHALCVNSTTK